MSTQDIRELTKRVNQLEMNASRGSMLIREAAMPIVRSGSGSDTDETIGTCCCDELDCLKIPGYDGEVLPLFYSFTLPFFDCGCENQAEQQEIRLYQVDPADDTIWESDPIRCIAPQGATIPCTVTSNWSWNAGLSNWDFVSNDQNGCSCTPSQPGFSGTTDGQTATTNCTGTKTADGATDLADSFWRLTIIDTLDYYGCNTTKLEFQIGGVAIHTFYLCRRCGGRAFCPTCSNSFCINTCGPTHCEHEPPSTICLRPRIPVETCTGCGHPVAILIENFNSSIDPAGVAYPEMLLTPLEGSPCCWRREWITLENDGVHEIDIDCGTAYTTRDTYFAVLTLCATLAGVDTYDWSLLLTVTRRRVATSAAPDCDVQIGDVETDGWGAAGTASPDIVRQSPLNCTDPFSLHIFGDTFGASTINFLDLSDANL